jgi:hypothetical protein
VDKGISETFSTNPRPIVLATLKAEDDPLGHRFQQPRIPFIHLHPAHPP